MPKHSEIDETEYSDETPYEGDPDHDRPQADEHGRQDVLEGEQ